MSYGLKQAKINVLGGVDVDIKCKETYERNIEGARFVHADVYNTSPEYIAHELNYNLNSEDSSNLILVGCTPCQYWSQIRTDKSKSRNTRNLLVEFLKFVEFFKPGYVIVENVPGIYKHRTKSKLSFFLDWLTENGYSTTAKIHDVSDYGIAQKRKRFTLIANRNSEQQILPSKNAEKKFVRQVLGVHNGFPKVSAGHKDQSEFMHTVAGLSKVNLARIMKVRKDGGSRFDFAADANLQLKCFTGKDNTYKDTYGRMKWDDLSPTITTKFYNISCGKFGHPDEDRAISLREGAALQSFPKSFIFKTTSIADTARIIGNAVPPKYAKALGEAIILAHG